MTVGRSLVVVGPALGADVIAYLQRSGARNAEVRRVARRVFSGTATARELAGAIRAIQDGPRVWMGQRDSLLRQLEPGATAVVAELPFTGKDK